MVALETRAAQPAPVLRPFIQRYVGSSFRGLRPGSHQGLPSRHLTMILGLGSSIDVRAMPDASQAPASFRGLVGGLHASPATIAYGTELRCLRVDLSPLGARPLLGLPAGELASRVFTLRDVMGGRGDELLERLGEAGTWSERFAAVDTVLTAVMTADGGPPPELTRAWLRLCGSAGRIRVDALAREVGWSRRHLGERFRAEFGLSLKVAARVLRFERACRLLERPGRPALAEVAASSGFVDQAHLTREWRRLAGFSPGAWLASDELPKVQDAGDIRAAD